MTEAEIRRIVREEIAALRPVATADFAALLRDLHEMRTRAIGGPVGGGMKPS